MRSVSGAVAAAFSSGAAVLATLVKIGFPSGTIALNSSSWDLDFGGTMYRGAAGLGSIAPITDQPGQLPGVQLELQQIDSAMISLALDGADAVQGSLVTISTAVLDSGTYQILDVVTDWIGCADKMLISEDGQKASIGLTAESKGVDLMRGSPLVYSDGDQQSLYPGDRAFAYVVSQSNQPVVWPARQWFYK